MSENKTYGVTCYESGNGVKIFFKGETVIAVSYSKGNKVCKNIWGDVMTEALNWIDGANKKERVPVIEFRECVKEALRESLVAEPKERGVLKTFINKLKKLWKK